MGLAAVAGWSALGLAVALLSLGPTAFFFTVLYCSLFAFS